MATTVSDRETQQSAGASTATSESLRLTVTGVDENGQMFRENAVISNLDGRDCRFRSKFQPELGSWVLVELVLSKGGTKHWTMQGQVKSVQPEGVISNLFQIQVELESTQDFKVASDSPKSQQSATKAANIESKEIRETLAPAVAPQPKPEAAVQSVPSVKIQPEKAPASAPISAPINLEPAVPARVESIRVTSEAAQAAATPEINPQSEALKHPQAKELEQMVQAAVNASMEKTVRASVEKHISANYQSTIQTLNSDITFQLAGRLANDEDLRNAIEAMAKKTVAEQIDQSRNTIVEAELALNQRTAEITKSLSESMAEVENRINAARKEIETASARTHTFEEETSQKLLQAIEQLNLAAKTTVEKFDGHVTAQLNSWSAQFKNHVDGVSREKASQFTTDLEKHLALQLQYANETLEKLSAGLQLAQGTIRMQEERMAELSRTVATALEKEMKAVLLRLSGTF